MKSKFVSEQKTDGRGNLKFRLYGLNVSFANAIRRTILTDIPCAVFKTIPHDKCQVEIIENTSKMNNEMIKHRLSAIPIHLNNLNCIHNLEVEVKVENTTEGILYVTTEHFNVSEIPDSPPVDDFVLPLKEDLFPIDEYSGQFIDLLKLLPDEKIHFKAKMATGTAREDSNFNMVSMCSYVMTDNEEKIKEAKANLQTTEWSEMKENDWKTIESHRIFIPNSFDFTVKTIGVYSNGFIVKTACDILITRLKTIEFEIRADFADMDNTKFEIVLTNEDHTVGKIIEYCFLNLFFENAAILSFCAFSKAHPDDEDCMIVVCYKTPTVFATVREHVIKCVSDCIEVLDEVSKEFV